MSAEDPVRYLASLTAEAAAAALGNDSVLLLPVGSLEAHGPHLPLDTDVVIAVETARRAAMRLAADGMSALLLPPLSYAQADCAAPFPGTVTLPSEAVRLAVVGIARSLAAPGRALLCLVNAHLEPDHIRALRRAVDAAGEAGCRVVFPDQTRRPHIDRLGEEFRRGGAHAGGYETSLVMAAGGPVDDAVRSGLPPNPVDLAAALRDGAADFRSIGGDRAYFGDPAAASVEEGERLYALLSIQVADAVRGALGR